MLGEIRGLGVIEELKIVGDAQPAAVLTLKSESAVSPSLS